MVSITIKPGTDPQLKRPKFICDAVLKKDVPDPISYLVNGFKVILVAGRPGAGKTSFTFSLFKDKRCLRKVWNHVLLVMPTESLNSMTPETNVFKNLSPDKQYPNLSKLVEIEERIRGFASDDETTVLIIDDQMAYLKDKGVERLLCSMMSNRRHMKLTIILLTQIVERVPLKCRKLVNDVILMYKPSKKEMVLVMDEFLEHKEDTALEIQKIAFQKPYDFLFIDVPLQKLFRNYDEIFIQE
jgi:predicted PilT family ATPase